MKWVSTQSFIEARSLRFNEKNLMVLSAYPVVSLPEVRSLGIRGTPLSRFCPGLRFIDESKSMNSSVCRTTGTQSILDNQAPSCRDVLSDSSLRGVSDIRAVACNLSYYICT